MNSALQCLSHTYELNDFLDSKTYQKRINKIPESLLLIEWDKYLDNGLLINIGNRFFLSNPKGMELSNQVMISMFKWWDKICSNS